MPVAVDDSMKFLVNVRQVKVLCVIDRHYVALIFVALQRVFNYVYYFPNHFKLLARCVT